MIGLHSKTNFALYAKFIYLLLLILSISFVVINFESSLLYLSIIFIFLIFVKNIKIGILVYLFSAAFIGSLLFAIFNDYFPIVTLGSSFFVLFISLYITYFLYGKKISFRINKFYALIVLLVLYFIFSILFVSSSKAYGFEKIQYLFSAIFLSILPFVIIRDVSDIDKIAIAFYIYGLILLFFSQMAFFFNVEYISSGIQYRFSVLNINPIWLGRYFSYSIISGLYLLKQYSKNKLLNFGKISFITATILSQLFFISLTGSRGPLISLILALIVSFIIYLRKYKLLRKLFFYFIAIILIIGVTSLFLPQTTIDRLTNKDASSKMTTAIRLLAYNEGLTNFWSNKLFGIGFGSYRYGGQFFTELHYPHNILIELLAEGGIVGFAIFFLLVIITLKALIENYNMLHFKHYLLILSLLICTFTNANLSGHIGYNPFFFFALGLNYCLYTNHEEIY